MSYLIRNFVSRKCELVICEFDATTKLATTTASGNLLIGVAVVAAPDPTAIGRVRLNGVSI